MERIAVAIGVPAYVGVVAGYWWIGNAEWAWAPGLENFGRVALLGIWVGFGGAFLTLLLLIVRLLVALMCMNREVRASCAPVISLQLLLLALSTVGTLVAAQALTQKILADPYPWTSLFGAGDGISFALALAGWVFVVAPLMMLILALAYAQCVMIFRAPRQLQQPTEVTSDA